MAGLSWDKTGRDVPSQTTLPATHTLGPHDDRTHEAGSLDAGNPCSSLSSNGASYTADKPLPLSVSYLTGS